MRLLLALLFSLVTSPLFAQVSVTIDSLPSNVGARFKVTGGNCQAGEYAAPTRLTWTAGPACRVEFLLPFYMGTEMRYSFVSWDDGSNTEAISIPIPATAASRFIRLRLESLIRADVRPPAAGTATGGGWRASGEKVTVRVTPSARFAPLRWEFPVCQDASYPDPFTIECLASLPATLTAVMRVTTLPLPRSYTVTRLPGLTGTFGGSLNSDGAVAGSAEVHGGRSAFLWQPEHPNSALGAVLNTPALATSLYYDELLIDDLGRLYFSAVPQERLSFWTPLSPGSGEGTVSPIEAPSNLNSGHSVAVNRFGQILACFGVGCGLWTPTVRGGTSGTAKLDAEFGYARAMNDFGQVLSEPGQSGARLGFSLFTPDRENSADGSFSRVLPPAGSTSTTVHAMNSRGDVAGTYCTVAVGGICPSSAFLWQPSPANSATGTMTEIAPPPGFASVSSVSAINAAGELAG